MKKQALLLMAGGVLAFASCNTATNEGASQAQIDSMVNVRVDEIRLEMMAQNDSLIDAMAQMKADSMIAAMKGGSVTTKTTTTKTTTKPKPSTPIQESPRTTKPNTVEKGGLKSQSDQNRANSSGTVEGGGLKSQSDKNRANNANKTEGGGLKSQSDQNRNK